MSKEIKRIFNNGADDTKEEINEVNERILKLLKSIKSRLVDFQIDDSTNSLVENYSHLHAIAVKTYRNNADASNLLIMSKIIEDLICELTSQ